MANLDWKQSASLSARCCVSCRPLLDSKTTDSAAAGDTSFFYLLAYLIQGTGDLSSQMSHTC